MKEEAAGSYLTDLVERETGRVFVGAVREWRRAARLRIFRGGEQMEEGGEARDLQ